MNLYLTEITKENFFDVINLKSSKEQEEKFQLFERWVGSNAFFIAMGSVYGFVNRAIYDGDTLIGFASHGLDEESNRYEMISIMLGHKYQGKGYGKATLQLVLEEMIEMYKCKEIFLTVIPENEDAIRVYEALGFKNTGEIFKAHHDELVFKLIVEK
ncbi:GNAT family N-acetyltransferase [Bacillus sp. BGMRC 2118]|nr:GNAT family N-acetyltransferase [Bacillus sp. BGMRC 2118]